MGRFRLCWLHALPILQVLEENLDWEDVQWSQTGVWIAEKEYALARAEAGDKSKNEDERADASDKSQSEDGAKRAAAGGLRLASHRSHRLGTVSISI
ncbi:hypothetical protein KSP39_PZI006933 [Platanthera zijinensis]|uniref:Uncharacterized protein n=1 Tax=Platanthera zijinensis TaxID=2320716 RepID=A0AAP0G9W3_9ASPA